MKEECKSAEEIIAAVRVYAAGSVSVQRELLGTNAQYFVHLKDGRRHLFALSKFCGFRNIRLSAYRGEGLHDKTGGTRARKLIARLTGQPWTPLRKTTRDSQRAFDHWFDTLPSNRAFNRDRFHLLEISASAFAGLRLSKEAKALRGKVITPEELAEIIEHQARIGAAGEEIAIQAEIKRLTKAKVFRPKDCVKQVSTENAALGYDIESVSAKGGVRRIEVKASTKNVRKGFYISESELEAMEANGKEAFLYLVNVKDVAKKKGTVEMLPNPARELRAVGVLQPTLYRAVLPKR